MAFIMKIIISGQAKKCHPVEVRNAAVVDYGSPGATPRHTGTLADTMSLTNAGG